VKDAEKIELVITLAERKYEHVLNNTNIFSSDERGLLYSRLSLESNMYQNRSLAVDTADEDSRIAAVYYYDPETDTEYLLWEKE